MRAATAARVLVGSACLTSPGRLLDLVDGADRDDSRTRVIARILGGRLVVQAVGDLAFGPRTRIPDVVIDATHAATMVGAARRWPDHRRSALMSAGLASAIALLELRTTPG